MLFAVGSGVAVAVRHHGRRVAAVEVIDRSTKRIQNVASSGLKNTHGDVFGDDQCDAANVGRNRGL